MTPWLVSIVTPDEEYWMLATVWFNNSLESLAFRKLAASVNAIVLNPRWSITRLLALEKPGLSLQRHTSVFETARTDKGEVVIISRRDERRSFRGLSKLAEMSNRPAFVHT
jgi:hypothetical protein